MKQRKEANMANTVPFDTLAYAKKLEAQGVEVKQAEAHAEVLAEVLVASFHGNKDSNVAIQEIGQEIRVLSSKTEVKFAEISNQFANVDVRFAEARSEIAHVKVDIIKWVFGISFAQAALIISVLKFFH